MKICVVGLRGLPHVMGGVEMHCQQLFPLMKGRHPNDSFTIIGRKAYLPEKVSEYQGLQIVSLPHARSKYLETITSTISGVLYARFVLHADLLHLTWHRPCPVGTRCQSPRHEGRRHVSFEELRTSQMEPPCKVYLTSRGVVCGHVWRPSHRCISMPRYEFETALSMGSRQNLFHSERREPRQLGQV
jgi:hypothetical protein